MKYQVLGPRVLLKVEKVTETFKNSSIVMPTTMKDGETTSQTIGEVLQIGPTAKSQYDGFEPLEEGKTVHFQRYGAQRINIKDEDEYEVWVINAKDILVIENEA